MTSFQQDTSTGADEHPKQRKSNGNKWAGLILLTVGAILLLNTLGANLPSWLISWQVGIIVVGIAIGFASKFRDFTWAVVCGVGIFLLISRLFPAVEMYRFIMPVIFIGVGLLVLYGSRGSWFSGSKRKDSTRYGLLTEDAGADSERLELISVFGGIKKTVYSKEFRGGEVVTIFGGGEVNLQHADFTGPIEIEVVQLFGGVKLIVPSHWEVTTSEAVAIFGGIDDKRPNNIPTDPAKRLILRGTIIFGGLEVRSY